MLPDKKIDSLGAHLEQFRLHDRGRQVDLDNLLIEYRQLLNEYKVLKRVHEEKITNAIAKPVAVTTPSVAAATRPLDSYVLVLVDGNDYIFNDELIRDKEEGGMRAARKLHDAIEKYIQQNVPQTLSRRVIVRIYADLTNLSKQLAKSKLTGLEKRSIASFTAGFTRAISLFDVIDTLDEEGTKFKIREQFKIASEDAACSHILFAACNDPAYLPLLVSYNGARDKVTLVQGSRWHPEFHQFNLEVTQLSTVFSWSGLPPALPVNKPATPTGHKQKASVQQPVLKPGLAALRKESWRRNDSVSVAESITGRLSPVLTVESQTPREDSWRRNGPVSATESAFGDSSPEESNDSVEPEPKPVRWDSPPPRDGAPQSVQQGPTKQKMCRHFKKGFCRAGDKCNFQHGPNSMTSSVNGGDGSQDSKPLLSPTLQSLSETSLTQVPAATSSQPSQAAIMDRSEISAYLPEDWPPGFIPLNKFQQRLDPYYPPPSSQHWKVYNKRFQRAKPCNTYHLEHSCQVYDCIFDHSELDPQERRVLEYVVKRTPCPRKGACRKNICIYGHLCQKEDCRGRKGHGSRKCWFKADLHYSPEECQLASLVPAEDEQEMNRMAMDHLGGGVGGGSGSGGGGANGGGDGLTVDDLVGMDEVDLMW